MQTLDEQLDTALAENAKLREEIASLQADLGKAQAKASQAYKASLQAPSPSPSASPKAAPTVAERFKAISDPTQQTAFLRTLDAKERAELYSSI